MLKTKLQIIISFIILGNSFYIIVINAHRSCYECKNEAQCLEGNLLITNCLDDKIGCVTMFDNRTKALKGKGCVTDLFSMFCQDDHNICATCLSNNCNIGKNLSEFIECLSCESDSEEPNCKQDPAAVSSIKLCHKSCLTLRTVKYYTKEDVITRGCLNDLEINDQKTCGPLNATCATCTESLCNDKFYPPDRMQCYYCDRDCHVEANVKPLACKTYTRNDECIAYFTKNRTISELFCRSDTIDISLGICLFTRECLTCSGPNCNDPNKIKPPIARWVDKCVICDSAVDEKCATSPELLTSTDCSSENHACFSRIENGRTIRGYSTDLTTDLIQKCRIVENDNCVICESDDCNNKIFPHTRQQCHICDYSEDKSCGNEIEITTKPAICRNFVANDYCFSVKTDTGVIRSCGSILGDICNKFSITCERCRGQGCNRVKIEFNFSNQLHVNCFSLIFSLLVSFVLKLKS